MTAFTPRVSGPAGDDDVEPAWPEARRARRRAVSAVREVPVDSAVVELAERERLVSHPESGPPQAEDRVARAGSVEGNVIDIRDDLPRPENHERHRHRAGGAGFDGFDGPRSEAARPALVVAAGPVASGPVASGPVAFGPVTSSQEQASPEYPDQARGAVPRWDRYDDSDPRGTARPPVTSRHQAQPEYAELNLAPSEAFAPGPVTSPFAAAPPSTPALPEAPPSSPVTGSVLPPRAVEPPAQQSFRAEPYTAEPFGAEPFSAEPFGAAPIAAEPFEAAPQPSRFRADGPPADRTPDRTPDRLDARTVARSARTDVTDTEADAPRARPGARHRAPTAPASVNRRVRLISAGAAGFTVAAVVMLWAAAGGLADLLSPALAIGSLSRLAGLLGTDLLLIQVLLMARIPAVERAFGRAALTRWHTLAGMVSFGLIVAHIALAISGTAIIERFNIFEAAWRLVSTVPGLTPAIAATALLVLVAVSSRREARHRRRDTRHLLAVYAYLGLLLALPHQLLAGTSLTASPLAAVYWWGLFLGSSLALLVFRLALPMFRSFRHQLVVDEVTVEAPGVVSLQLRGRKLRHLGARAGEFFHWRFLDGAQWHQAMISPLSAVPSADRMRVTLAVGEGSRLDSLTPGTWVLFEGPYGSLTSDSRTKGKLAFFTAGLGIAPVRALLEDLDYGRDEAVVVYRLADDEQALFRDELDAISKRRGAEVVYLEGPTAEDRESWLPATAAAQIADPAAVTHLVPDIATRDVFVSGPEHWAQPMLAALREAGVPPGQIHAEVIVA